MELCNSTFLTIYTSHSIWCTVTGTIKRNVLRWKFEYYDRNGDGVLHPAEQFVFKLELYEFVGCKTFFDHVTELIDEDSSGTITNEEWNNFFNENGSGVCKK